MEITNFIKDNMLIICPNNYKKYLLELFYNEHKLLNIKFMNIDEYKKNYLFDYDIKTIHYLVKKYSMKVDNAITLINNLYYIENKKYDSEKLNYLVEIKKELDDNNLLIYNSLFKNILDSYQIGIIGYGKLDKFSLSLFNNPIIYEDNFPSHKFFVYHFTTIEEEMEYLFNEISNLLKNNIDINHIYLMNVNNEYYPYLKRFSSYYNIPVDIPSDDNILGTTIGKKFVELINNANSYEEVVNGLDSYKENSLYSILINILNKYVEFDLNDVNDLIMYDLSNTKIPNINYINQIKIIDVNDLVDESDYVFLLGFNNPLIPNIKLDEDYITDNIKSELNMDTTIELNKISKINTLNSLLRIKNIKISYKDRTPFNQYYPSILLDDMDYDIVDYQTSYNYSANYNKVKYTYLLDDFVKYGMYHNDLGTLYYNYSDINYRKYNNQYDGINVNNLLEFINNDLTLSYSHIDNYYKCGFKYYLTNILKIDIYEETFQAFVGSLFHEVLRHYLDDNFDFDKCYENFLKDKEFSNKETFFLNKLKNDLLFIIETLKEHREITGFTKELYEEKINIKLNDFPKVNFKGFVDKIMYKEKGNETLVSIIDYKTGNPDINIKNLKFGLSMQLPVYLYLISNSNLFPNMKFTGFYLQHILNNEIKISEKKTYLEQKKDNLKLVGYSTNDKNRLASFDITYEKSDMIKGMKVKADGELASTSNSLSDEEIKSIETMVHDKIMEAMNNILKADFSINPKIKNNLNLSCGFCKFRDICYRNEKDYVYLKDEEEGDINA